MIALRVTVPIACWRKPHARELLETAALPPPATCYGALLSLVGETDRDRHRGARVSAGTLRDAAKASVLRTLWRIKEPAEGLGNKRNARPDHQQVMVQSDLVLFCDSAEEARAGEGLERRVVAAMRDPGAVDRFGGWCLGESTHLINDAWLIEDARPPAACRTFVVDARGTVTAPVWVDHVGSLGTRYATGALVTLTAAPQPAQLPRIEPR